MELSTKSESALHPLHLYSNRYTANVLGLSKKSKLALLFGKVLDFLLSTNLPEIGDFLIYFES